MAEIAVLPTASNRAATERLIGALAQAVENGTDLGSRGLHVRSLGQSLEVMLQEFRQQVEWIESSVTLSAYDASEAKQHLSKIILHLEKLCVLARNYPV